LKTGVELAMDVEATNVDVVIVEVALVGLRVSLAGLEAPDRPAFEGLTPGAAAVVGSSIVILAGFLDVDGVVQLDLPRLGDVEPLVPDVPKSSPQE
jgi:hypothetical protein